MKAETKVTNHIPSGHPEPASQQADDSQGYEHQQAIKAECFHPLGIFEEFPIEDVETSIPKRFEKIVREYPDRLAVQTPNYSLKYSELNAVANRIAAALLEQRVNETRPVALLFEKDAPLVAAMLGVLKAGKVFLLLDPSLPKERIASILHQSQVELAFTDGLNALLAGDVAGSHHTRLDFESIDYASPIDNLCLPIAPDVLAFIIYTSGSTGQPKGVIQNHRNFLRNMMLRTNTAHISPQDRISLLTSGTANTICFTFLALLNGAALFPFDFKKQGVNQLVRWLLQSQISICPMSSALFRNLCDSLTGNEVFPHLRLIRLTSETAYKSDVEQFKKYFSTSCILSTGLSTSETGVLTNYVVDPRIESFGSKIPVGYAVDDTEILLLDDAGKQVGCNQIGEIVVRSHYLSPGYWRQPDLTQSKFKIDPNGGDKRLYFSGDLGRKLPDGCLLHEGRKDFRVQIRGYGVEIAEVETTLLGHPAVREAVVMGRQNGFGETRLVGYFTSATEPRLSVSELRRFLLSKLPDYMVPSVLLRLVAIPLTTNGKVNRQALPDPANLRPDLDVAFVAARTPIEKKLTKIWAKVLGIERVGILDDFFDLGGHSLLASRLFVQIEKAFGKQLSPPTLLYARTIEQLADIVRQKVQPASWSLLVPIQPNGTRPPFFWAGGYSSDIYLPRLLGQDQPLYGLLNQCHDGNRAVYSRLKDIAAHHLQEICAVQPRGPYYLGGLCFGGMVAFEMAQQLKQQGQKVALLFLVDLATIINVKALTDQIPDFPKPLREIESFRDELFRHLGELTKLKHQEKLIYVRVRVVDRIKALRDVVKDVVKNLVCRGCVITGHPIPPSLQLNYIVTVDRRVLRDYQPQAYAGRIVHIKAEASTYDPQLVAKLTAGGLEAYELPCRHGEIIKEPHVAVWANQLKSYLQEAQATQRGTQPSVSPREDNEESHLEQAIATR